ncbi:hypothetical protein FHG87_005947 [Trinorchestia longiramus]|nr:hypothetical protein FHG87_005947 [Trinorchestia longiramus]
MYPGEQLHPSDQLCYVSRGAAASLGPAVLCIQGSSCIPRTSCVMYPGEQLHPPDQLCYVSRGAAASLGPAVLCIQGSSCIPRTSCVMYPGEQLHPSDLLHYVSMKAAATTRILRFYSILTSNNPFSISVEETMRWHAGMHGTAVLVLLCSALCSVPVHATATKKLVSSPIFVVADPADSASISDPASASAPRGDLVAVASEQDHHPAATGYHKRHHSEDHKGKKGGKKSYKSGFIKGHDHKDKKGYHKDDHHEKHSFGDYAKGHHSKHKGGGGKDYKGSEHKNKHKGGYKKGDKGAKGKIFGHEGKYHKGHHDKGFKHKEDHDAHGHKHDDKYKMATGKYGSSYDEEEGYYKKGKGKHHKGGKFAGGKTWDYKGGDSFSISGKYHDDYSDVKGKYGYHGKEHHQHKKGAKGGHKSGKSHKKGDAHKGHKGDDHKGHHSHYAPVHSGLPAHGLIKRQDVAHSEPTKTQTGSHSSPSHSENIQIEPPAETKLAEPRQYHVFSPRHPQNSQSRPIYRNRHQPQHTSQHPRNQGFGKPKNLSHSSTRNPKLLEKRPRNKPHHVRYSDSPDRHRAPPAPANHPRILYADPPLTTKDQSHYNPHNDKNPHGKLRHQLEPSNGKPHRGPHPNSIQNIPRENDRARPITRHPKSIPGLNYDNKPVHGSHSAPLHAPQHTRDSSGRGHSQSVSYPQQGSYSQPEIVVPGHSEPDHSELPDQRYVRPHRRPKKGRGRGRPRKYKKLPVNENEVIDEPYRENSPPQSEDEHDGGSEDNRAKEYNYYEREQPRYEKQEDSRRENRIPEDDRYYKNSRHRKPDDYEDARTTHDSPYQKRPPSRHRDDRDKHSELTHESTDSRKQYDNERQYPGDDYHRGSYSGEKEDSQPSYENRQQAKDKPRHTHQEEPAQEDDDDSDNVPHRQNYQQYNRESSRPYHREELSSQRQEEPNHQGPSRAPGESEYQHREQNRPSPKDEQTANDKKQSGGLQTKNQQRGFYFPTLGHPLGFNNFAVGASNVPPVGTQKKLEPAASVFSLGHSQFSFDTFGDFGKFMPTAYNKKG